MEVEFTVGSRSIVLTDYGRIIDGRRGDLAPLTTLETKRLGSQLVKSIYRQEKRAVDFPFLFKAASEATLLSSIRSMLDVLSAGEGTLAVTRNDSVVRELYRCYYVGGLGEKGYVRAAEAVLSFDALDPYWYDPADTEVEFAIPAIPEGTFFPILPVTLVPSSVLQRQTVNNPGVQVWPIWTITGPGSDISLINETNGRAFLFETILDETDTLVIDTRPLYKTVQLNGANAWADVPKTYADLWPLEPGDNSILVTVANATDVTLATLAYQRRYISL